MQEQIHLSWTDRKYILLCDNVTLYKEKQVINYYESLKNSNIYYSTIFPTLNSA